MSYKPTKRMSKGITFPTIVTPDTGIQVVRTLGKPDRYKVWFHENGKRRYLTLPAGTSLAEARERRGHLYAALKAQYGGKRRTPRKVNTRGGQKTVLTVRPTQYIYRQPEKYFVKIGGRHIAEARTVEEAAKKRDAWLRKYGALVPHVKLEEEAV